MQTSSRYARRDLGFQTSIPITFPYQNSRHKCATFQGGNRRWWSIILDGYRATKDHSVCDNSALGAWTGIVQGAGKGINTYTLTGSLILVMLHQSIQHDQTFNSSWITKFNKRLWSNQEEESDHAGNPLVIMSDCGVLNSVMLLYSPCVEGKSRQTGDRTYSTTELASWVGWRNHQLQHLGPTLPPLAIGIISQ